MGVYIEGLDRPRNEYMRIHIDFDGEVWVFRGSGWKSLGIKATDLDIVRCRECKKHGKNSCPMTFTYAVITDDNNYCTYAERRENDDNI